MQFWSKVVHQLKLGDTITQDGTEGEAATLSTDAAALKDILLAQAHGIGHGIFFKLLVDNQIIPRFTACSLPEYRSLQLPASMLVSGPRICSLAPEWSMAEQCAFAFYHSFFMYGASYDMSTCESCQFMEACYSIQFFMSSIFLSIYRHGNNSASFSCTNLQERARIACIYGQSHSSDGLLLLKRDPRMHTSFLLRTCEVYDDAHAVYACVRGAADRILGSHSFPKLTVADAAEFCSQIKRGPWDNSITSTAFVVCLARSRSNCVSSFAGCM